MTTPQQHPITGRTARRLPRPSELRPLLRVARPDLDPTRRRLARADEWFALPAIMLFVYFYPILSAAPLSGPQAFNRWMWFDSWR